MYVYRYVRKVNTQFSQKNNNYDFYFSDRSSSRSAYKVSVRIAGSEPMTNRSHGVLDTTYYINCAPGSRARS